MHVGSIVCTTHIAVPKGARGIVQRVLGDMAMVTWYAGVPGESKELNTEPFFLEDLIDTGESVLPNRRGASLSATTAPGARLSARLAAQCGA